MKTSRRHNLRVRKAGVPAAEVARLDEAYASQISGIAKATITQPRKRCTGNPS